MSTSDAAASGSNVWTATIGGAALAALESVGFRAVGVAMGMSVYAQQPYTAYPVGSSPISRSMPNQQFYPCPHGRSGPAHAPGLNYRQRWAQAPRRVALKNVLDKLRSEGSALGAHGVIGISIEHSVFRSGEPPIQQLRMTGTAVRAIGAAAPAPGVRPFTTTLDAAALIELLLSGRSPVGLVFGNAVVGVLPGCVLRTTKRRAGIVELDQLGDASQSARAAAMDDLRSDASRLGTSDVTAIELDLGGALNITAGGWTSVHAYATGTAIRRFDTGLAHVGARQVFRLRGGG